MENRAEELLDVEYFHTVFTLPSEFRELAYQNKKCVYDLFFEAVSETLKAVAQHFLGTAEIGFIAILRTWNQLLQQHPHLHVVIPKGGISTDRTQWIAPKGNFFLPVRALSKVYRGKLTELLRAAHRQGKFRFFNHLTHLESTKEFEQLLAQARRTEWVVYSKKPFGGPAQVLKYLGCYVHRVAISNYRLRTLDHQHVTFACRDSRNSNKRRLYSLSTSSFARRFLLHVLPKGFRRIRHYGFLANNIKQSSLLLVRALLTNAPGSLPTSTTALTRNFLNSVNKFRHSCTICKLGTLLLLSNPFNPHSATFTLLPTHLSHPALAP